MAALFKIILSSIFLFINLFLQIHLISAQTRTRSYDCNNPIGNYTKNTNFQANLNTILSSITSKINMYGFYNNTAGDGVDQANAIALCRGDIDIEECRGCVNDAARNLTGLFCPNQREAIIWVDECMFRYSNNKILGVLSIFPANNIYNPDSASNWDSFSREIRSFAGNLVHQAYNGTFRKYAGLKYSDPSAQTIFGLMQCTPDITPDDCMSCLQACVNSLSYDKTGGRRTTPSCTFRYEIYPFLNKLSNQSLLLPSPPPPLPPSTPPPPPTGTGKSKTIIILLCVNVALLVPTLIACVFFTFTKRRWQNTSEGHRIVEEEELEAIGDTETRQYDFALIRAATNDFSTANLLGRGGFGDVYKSPVCHRKMLAWQDSCRILLTCLSNWGKIDLSVTMLDTVEKNIRAD